MNKLNMEQLKAVTSFSSNTLVIAGAGTGKTKVLTERIFFLLKNGIAESEILAFAFTNKAASEMKSRIESLLNRPHSIVISTFHSYCYLILQDYKDFIGFDSYFTLIDDDDKARIIRKIIKEENYPLFDKLAIKMISFIKNHCDTNLDLHQQLLINALFHRYQEVLRKSNKMDFDDLLYYTYRLLDNSFIAESLRMNIKHILIDECQDSNKIQMDIIYKLAENANLFLVGDLNQSIYSFRGSSYINTNNFIAFKKPEIIKLTANYRSSSNIINAANSLIDNNKYQIKNYLISSSKTDNQYQIISAKLNNEISEAVYISDLIFKLISKGYSYNAIAILYRNNSIPYSLEKELIIKKIPYQLIGTISFFKRKEIKILISYYQFLFNHNDNLALEYIYNIPPRSLGEQTYSSIVDYAKLKNITLWESIKVQAEQNNNLKSFINLIEYLKKEFTKLSPGLFLKCLITKIKYSEYTMNQPDSKSKMNRLYEFYNLIDAIPLNSNPEQSTINFLNELMLQNEKENTSDKVNLLTIHQSKGLEFPIVIIIGINKGIIPPISSDLHELEEERRLFYVAITRAKERLYLLSTHQRTINGKKVYLDPSPFLNEIKNYFINVALKK